MLYSSRDVFSRNLMEHFRAMTIVETVLKMLFIRFHKITKTNYAKI